MGWWLSSSTSVRLACLDYNKMPEAGWLIELLLTVPKVQKVGVADLASGEDPLPGSWTAVPSPCPCMVEEVRGLLALM